MAYFIYLGKMLLPVAPAKLQLKVNNQNKTLTLINEGEVNLLKPAGLTEVSFEALLPQVQYSFAVYKNGFQRAQAYLEQLEELKTQKEPFQFIVTRTFPNGKMLFDTNLKVSLEDYKMKEDAQDGFDVMVELTLKQYKAFFTKTCNITFAKEKPKVSTEPKRETSAAPKLKSHKVVKGDCLYNIAKTYYGNGKRYLEIYNANRSEIDGKNKGTGNPQYTIYPNQVFVIPV